MKAAEKRKKTTVEISESLLNRALKVSGKSINETVALGLRLVSAKEAYDRLLELRGTYRSKMNIGKLREDR